MKRKSQIADLLFLAGALALVFLVEFLPGLSVTEDTWSWYSTLVQPAWSPPGWVFGPVWTFLYISMALALYLVWKKGATPLAYTLWGVQLGINFLFTFLFFVGQSLLLGWIDIALLWLAIIATCVVFWRISAWAGILFLPYIAWVSYALSLSFFLWLWN